MTDPTQPAAMDEVWNGRPPAEHEDAVAHMLRWAGHGRCVPAEWDACGVWTTPIRNFVDDEAHKLGWTYIGPLTLPTPAADAAPEAEAIEAPFDKASFMAFAERAYGWSVCCNGDAAGLVVGDQGYGGSKSSLGAIAVHAFNAASLEQAEALNVRLEALIFYCVELLGGRKAPASPAAAPPSAEGAAIPEATVTRIWNIINGGWDEKLDKDWGARGAEDRLEGIEDELSALAAASPSAGAERSAALSKEVDRLRHIEASREIEIVSLWKTIDRLQLVERAARNVTANANRGNDGVSAVPGGCIDDLRAALSRTPAAQEEGS